VIRAKAGEKIPSHCPQEDGKKTILTQYFNARIGPSGELVPVGGEGCGRVNVVQILCTHVCK
jgi:hypothetical protein